MLQCFCHIDFYYFTIALMVFYIHLQCTDVSISSYQIVSKSCFFFSSSFIVIQFIWFWLFDFAWHLVWHFLIHIEFQTFTIFAPKFGSNKFIRMHKRSCYRKKEEDFAAYIHNAHTLTHTTGDKREKIDAIASCCHWTFLHWSNVILIISIFHNKKRHQPKQRNRK